MEPRQKQARAEDEFGVLDGRLPECSSRGVLGLLALGVASLAGCGQQVAG